MLNAVITQSDLPIYRSVVARNAEESEELLCTQQDIGLVAAECDIPTEGSQDLVFVLLQDQRLQGVPIVVLASIVDPRRIEKLLDLGAAAFFRIPFDPTLLQRQLAEVLERSTAAASLKED
ncbi:MAG: hypothetical protein HY820_29375 [Acidobacteria bacterium]|nr:hypothetical protein [Acidobacteriota bacterium]